MLSDGKITEFFVEKMMFMIFTVPAILSEPCADTRILRRIC